MANGRRSPIFNLRSCPSLCKDCSTYQILLCSLSLSITKESKSKAPKSPPKPSVPNFDRADEPPPYRPGEKASGDEIPFTSPSSSKTGSDDSDTPKEISTLPPLARTRSKHMFPFREVAGPEGPTRVHVPFSISDMSQIEGRLGSCSENFLLYFFIERFYSLAILTTKNSLSLLCSHLVSLTH